MTKRGVETDLDRTIYKSIYGDYIFSFSSRVYKNKFDGMIDSYIKDETYKLYKRYNTNVVADYYLAISLYRKIEKRGFRVVNIKTQEVISYYKIYEVR